MTRSGVARSGVTGLLVTALLAAATAFAAVLAPTAAWAAECAEYEAQANPLTGAVTYVCVRWTGGDPGQPGTPGGGGDAPEPACDLVGAATWCMGDRACYTRPTLPPVALPPGPKPSPDAVALTDWCYEGGVITVVSTYWSETGEPPVPPLQEQAEVAIGQLDLGLPALSTSPVDRTVVNFPTWFWVEGGEPTQTGSSAFGLVAIATVRSLQVAPGDGTALTCPWTTSAAQAEEQCVHTYDRASHDGTATWQGRPAYTVSATSTWDLRFEVNGTPVTIPGVQTTIQGPPSTAVLRVDEVQSVVTGVR